MIFLEMFLELDLVNESWRILGDRLGIVVM